MESSKLQPSHDFEFFDLSELAAHRFQLTSISCWSSAFSSVVTFYPFTLKVRFQVHLDYTYKPWCIFFSFS